MFARIDASRFGIAPALVTESQSHSSQMRRRDSTKLMRVGSTFAAFATPVATAPAGGDAQEHGRREEATIEDRERVVRDARPELLRRVELIAAAVRPEPDAREEVRAQHHERDHAGHRVAALASLAAGLTTEVRSILRRIRYTHSAPVDAVEPEASPAIAAALVCAHADALRPKSHSIGSLPSRARACEIELRATVPPPPGNARSSLLTTSSIGRSRNNAIPRTTQITSSTGSRRRRTVAVPVIVRASSIHAASMWRRNVSKCSGFAYVAVAANARSHPMRSPPKTDGADPEGDGKGRPRS